MSDDPDEPCDATSGSASEGDDDVVHGVDLARRALEQAKAAARVRGVARARQPTRAGRRRPAAEASAGGSDPQLFGAALTQLISDRGWDKAVKAAAVTGRWDRLVGPELAAHCQPESLCDGELVIVAESTAWATQIRLLNTTMLVRLRAELGCEVVRSIRVHGPTAPSWRKGPLRVVGRGPRDTYG